ncbi:hypothetical protein AGR9A_Cc210221 [Agrobacterium salinitolerans str. Hayward 0363]|nr:hypothetical protein AGR9A_Cc210221 [Agrobacterium salinitolerans str. Hayward 0363]
MPGAWASSEQAPGLTCVTPVLELDRIDTICGASKRLVGFAGGPSSRFARFSPEAVSLPGSLCDKRKKHILKAGLLDGSGATAAPGSMTWQM